MSKISRLTITGEQTGQRLDSALAALVTDHSRTRLVQLIKSRQVAVDGQTISAADYRVNAGQEVLLTIPDPSPPVPNGEPLPLDILYEDQDIIVIDKPAGMVVHPGAGHLDATLVNALIHHCGASLSGIGGVMRPGIVHRLDKDTSGVLVAAKNDHAHRELSAQFADHGRTGALKRQYIAFVWGALLPAVGEIDAPIDRDPRNRLKQAVRKRGRRAITHYQTLKRYGEHDSNPMISQLSCRLETGRTHQIRVHFAYLRHPVLADPLYASAFQTKARLLPDQLARGITSLNRQALHACTLVIRHPRTEQIMAFESPLPADLARLEMLLDQFNAKAGGSGA